MVVAEFGCCRGCFAGVAQCKKKNLVITAEHSKHVEIDNQVITKL
jgi:hypothetical protein